MIDAHVDSALSDRAQARAREMLPGLLAAVRGRRRRRRVVQAGAACAALALAVVLWRAAGDDPVRRPDEPGTPVAAWTVCRDDPTTLQRLVAPTVRRAEWFVDDAGLQRLLVDAGRPRGLVRCAGRVRVSARAVDPWPGASDLQD